MITKQFSFKSPRQVQFGLGSHSLLDDLILLKKGQPSDKILVLSDRGVNNAGLLDKVLEPLKKYHEQMIIIDDIPTEPFEEDIQDILDRSSNPGINQIIAVGGGSVLDTAKLISHLLKSGGTVTGLRTSIPPVEGVPMIMLPTTAGTGSEATPNSIIALKDEEVKVGFISEYFLPGNVILDPELTLSLPPNITAAGGVDAFCHLLECFISKKSNPYSDAMAMKGMDLALNNIEAAYTKGQDIEARSAMMMASYYGGACISSSGTTAVHALSYPLGGKFRIPHGVANAILLVPVFEFIKNSIKDKLSLAAGSSGLRNTSSDYFISYLADLIERLNIPSSVREYGVKPEDLDYLAEKAFGIRRLLDSTPQELSIDDIKSIYRKIL